MLRLNFTTVVCFAPKIIVHCLYLDTAAIKMNETLVGASQITTMPIIKDCCNMHIFLANVASSYEQSRYLLKHQRHEPSASF